MENESYWDRKGYMEITCRHEVSWMGLEGNAIPGRTNRFVNGIHDAQGWGISLKDLAGAATRNMLYLAHGRRKSPKN